MNISPYFPSTSFHIFSTSRYLHLKNRPLKFPIFYFKLIQNFRTYVFWVNLKNRLHNKAENLKVDLIFESHYLRKIVLGGWVSK